MAHLLMDISHNSCQAVSYGVCVYAQMYRYCQAVFFPKLLYCTNLHSISNAYLARFKIFYLVCLTRFCLTHSDVCVCCVWHIYLNFLKSNEVELAFWGFLTIWICSFLKDLFKLLIAFIGLSFKKLICSIFKKMFWVWILYGINILQIYHSCLWL